MTSIVRNGELIPEGTATVIVDVDLDAEIPCQELDPCDNPAAWRTGPLACGHGGRLMCNDFHEWISKVSLDYGYCECGHVEPLAPWLAKWVRI